MESGGAMTLKARLSKAMSFGSKAYIRACFKQHFPNTVFQAAWSTLEGVALFAKPRQVGGLHLVPPLDPALPPHHLTHLDKMKKRLKELWRWPHFFYFHQLLTGVDSSLWNMTPMRTS